MASFSNPIQMVGLITKTIFLSNWETNNIVFEAGNTSELSKNLWFVRDNQSSGNQIIIHQPVTEKAGITRGFDYESFRERCTSWSN